MMILWLAFLFSTAQALIFDKKHVDLQTCGDPDDSSSLAFQILDLSIQTEYLFTKADSASSKTFSQLPVAEQAFQTSLFGSGDNANSLASVRESVSCKWFLLLHQGVA